jgi:MoaA/NifB/PqqE/SkfB family radical SAM enzyme
VKLLIVLTARCNALCSHCSTSCGPHRTGRLALEQLVSLMDQAARLSGRQPLVLALSGGEPFLDFKLLVEVVRHAARLGASGITCTTNAYWATSHGKALALLTTLKSAGLTGLGISTSRFHEAFVKRARVARALQAGRAAGLACGIKYVRGESDARRDASVIAWARRHGAQSVEVIPVMPALRSGQVLAEGEYRRPYGLPAGPCPASVLTIREDGQAFTCGAPGSDTALLSLGNANERGLEEILDRYRLGGVQQILRRQGPAFLAREVARHGAAERLRPAYSGVCELCTHIARDPVMAPIAATAAASVEARLWGRLVARIAGTAGEGGPSRGSSPERCRRGVPPATGSSPGSPPRPLPRRPSGGLPDPGPPGDPSRTA